LFKKKTNEKIYNTDYQYYGEDYVKDEWKKIGNARIKKMGYKIDDKFLDGTKLKGWSSEFEFVEDAIRGWKGGSKSYQAVQADLLQRQGVKLNAFGRSRAKTGSHMSNLEPGQIVNKKKLTKKKLEEKKKRYELFKKRAEALEDFVERAPTFSGETRRGLQIDFDDFDEFLMDLADGTPSGTLESWTSDLTDTANDFAGVSIKDGKYYRGENWSSGGKIHTKLIVKDNKYGVSIQELGDGYQHEQEVLIPSKIRYRIVDIKTHRVYNDPDFSEANISKFMGRDDEVWEITLEQL
jgi:hypothetical protein